MLVLALSLLSSAAVPSRAWSEESKPRPKRQRPKLSFVIAGTAMFAAGYLPALVFGGRFTQGELGIPILGPLIDLRRCNRCTGTSAENGAVAGLVLDAAVQAAGLALVLVGVIRRPASPKRTNWLIVPSENGIAALGTF